LPHKSKRAFGPLPYRDGWKEAGLLSTDREWRLYQGEMMARKTANWWAALTGWGTATAVPVPAAELIDAVKHSDAAEVRALLDKGAKVNAADNNGRTALMEASSHFLSEDMKHLQKGRFLEEVQALLEVVQTLLDKGAKVNAADNNGRTALMEACKGGNREVVQVLLDKRAEVNAKANNGTSALIEACRKEGNREVVEALLEKGADVNARDNNGFTALMEASAYSLRGNWGRREMLRALLDRGADLEARDFRGRTALILASLQGSYDAVETLRFTAAVNAASNDGSTALMEACAEGRQLVVELLLQLQHLEVNATNHNGETALILASRNGHREVVQALLDKGADVNAKANDGGTALTMARSTEVRAVLMQIGEEQPPVTRSPCEILDEAALEQAVGSSVSAHLQVFAQNVEANPALTSLATIVTFAVAEYISDIANNVTAADKMGRAIEKTYNHPTLQINLLHTSIIAEKNHKSEDYLDSHYDGLVWLKQHESKKQYVNYIKNYLQQKALSDASRFVHLVTIVHKINSITSDRFRVISHLAIMPVKESYFQACPMYLWPTSLLSKSEARELGLQQA
jgi:ankyrin repeat protein